MRWRAIRCPIKRSLSDGSFFRECCTKCHSRTFEANVLRLCTKDEMQGAEDEDEGSVLMYVTEARIPKATQQIAFVQQSLLNKKHPSGCHSASPQSRAKPDDWGYETPTPVDPCGRTWIG